MKWEKERLINVPIETVWSLFEEENAQRIMPKVVENRWIERKPGVVGSTYEQTYSEGKRKETYVVEIKDFEDTQTYKFKHIQFQLARAFEMNLSFKLEKISEKQTKFTYAGSNEGINFVGRAMLKLGSSKNGNQVIDDFLDRVEQESIKELETLT